MTRSEATSLGIYLLGGIGIGASITMVLIGLDTGDRRALVEAAVLFSIGLGAMLVSGFRTKE